MDNCSEDHLVISARLRAEKILARVRLTEQQIECFSQEVVWTLERLTVARLALTQELCRTLRRASPLLAEVQDKFMRLLEVRERSWPAFQVRDRQTLISDFEQLKRRMAEVNPDTMTEEQLSALLPIWQLHKSGSAGLSPAGLALCHFIALCVEVKLKSETRASAERRLPRLQRKLSSHRSLLAGLEAGEKGEWNDVDEKLSSDLTGLTGDFCKAVVLEERTVGVRHLRHGTASGGLLSRAANSLLHSSDVSFPDFEGQDLYQERPPEEDWEVGESEAVRLCGGGFFCL